MDKEFKTTFIPKKNLSQVKTQGVSKKSRAQQSILGMLALLLFVTALVAVAGVYLYKARIASVLNQHIDSINVAEKAFEPAVILELKRLDLRLRAGTELLDQHIAISDFLVSLSESTLPDVSYSDFSFAYNPEGSEISITGEARGYLQLAQQSDVFVDNQYIQNPIFSDFGLTDADRVTFSLSFTLNPELLAFGRTVTNDQSENISADEISAAIIEDRNPLTSSGNNIDFGAFTNSTTN